MKRKEKKNEKGGMRNEGTVLWRVGRRGMKREKLWIGVWMRENERDVGNSWRMREKECGNNKTLNFFKFQNYEREFHETHINRRRERIVQLLKGCVSSRGATF